MNRMTFPYSVVVNIGAVLSAFTTWHTVHYDCTKRIRWTDDDDEGGKSNNFLSQYSHLDSLAFLRLECHRPPPLMHFFFFFEMTRVQYLF